MVTESNMFLTQLWEVVNCSWPWCWTISGRIGISILQPSNLLHLHLDGRWTFTSGCPMFGKWTVLIVARFRILTQKSKNCLPSYVSSSTNNRILTAHETIDGWYNMNFDSFQHTNFEPSGFILTYSWILLSLSAGWPGENVGFTVHFAMSISSSST